MSESDVNRRQILTYKDGLRKGRITITYNISGVPMINHPFMTQSIQWELNIIFVRTYFTFTFNNI